MDSSSAPLGIFVVHISNGSKVKARQVLNYLRGLSEVRPILHAINCDAPVFIPEGWSIREEDQLPNRVKGILTWDPAKARRYLSKRQKGDKYIVGNNLRKELACEPVLSANVLDYLLKPENQHLIPEEWKGKAVVFWGTIYRHSHGYLYVRYLFWYGVRWHWHTLWLDGYFHSSSPAVVLAS